MKRQNYGATGTTKHREKHALHGCDNIFYVT